MDKYIIIIIIIGIIVWITLAIFEVNRDKEYTGCFNYTVLAGDTLWSIASKYCPDDVNIQAYILELKLLNKKEYSDVQVGEVLLIPINEEE